MASLSVLHSLQINHFPTMFSNKPRNKIQNSIVCQSREPVKPSDPENKKKKEDQKLQSFGIFNRIENWGSALKENLSPKKKGDWKDVLWMSLSFAVYVYISQQIVCTYCAWISMLKN